MAEIFVDAVGTFAFGGKPVKVLLNVVVSDFEN
jgi:hypothetical protein